MASDVPVRSWDVVVVPFPYSERLAEKRRPAVVVSSLRLHREGYVWIAMITGAGKVPVVGDVAIEGLRRAGLPGASMVRASKIATVEPSRILRKVGTLGEEERGAVQRAISGFLAP